MLICAGIVPVDAGFSTHVHIYIVEYYNDSASHPRKVSSCIYKSLQLLEFIIDAWEQVCKRFHRVCQSSPPVQSSDCKWPIINAIPET